MRHFSRAYFPADRNSRTGYRSSMKTHRMPPVVNKGSTWLKMPGRFFTDLVIDTSDIILLKIPDQPGKDIIEDRLVSRCSKHKNRSRHIILNPINPWGKHMCGLAGSTSDFPEQESGIRKFHQDLNHRKVVLIKNIGFNFALLHIQCLERLVLVQLPLSTAFSHAPEYPENL